MEHISSVGCNASITKREKDDNERMEEIKATHDRTVFSICNNDKTPLVSGAGGEEVSQHVQEKNAGTMIVLL